MVETLFSFLEEVPFQTLSPMIDTTTFFHMSFVLFCFLFYLCFVNILLFLLLSLYTFTMKVIFCSAEPVPVNPCHPSPCGPNTICRVVNNLAICECLPEFYGSPSDSGCRPECVISADCPRNKACVNNKCRDPCPGVCGFNALCNVINHSPVCSCPTTMVGDPFVECHNAPGKFNNYFTLLFSKCEHLICLLSSLYFVFQFFVSLH